MEKILAVLTKEKKYAERFCSYCNRKNELLFTAVPFSSGEECAAFSKKHKIGILLADTAFLNPGAASGSGRADGIRAERILKLSEEGGFQRAFAEGGFSWNAGTPEEGTGRPAGGDTIRKYQPAEQILRELMQSCEGIELLRERKPSARPVRVIGVYSPVRRCGKTSFALTLSAMLGKRKKTLYLNFGEFTGLEAVIGERTDSSLSDALYHMKQGSLNAGKLYGMIARCRGIDYIGPIRFADDRSALSGEDYVRLIGEIIRHTQYEAIVVDMDRYAEEASELLEICDKVYMPVLDGPAERAKTDRFLEYLRDSERGRIADKIVSIRPPEPEKAAGGAGYLDSLLYGPMGEFVRSLEEA